MEERTVIIHVLGGVADVYKKPDDINVIIVNWDNISGREFYECPRCGKETPADFVCENCGFDVTE
jgi:hypothetical protein